MEDKGKKKTRGDNFGIKAKAARVEAKAHAEHMKS